ncbi:hypothetical protein SLA2020_500510 [Shorea laevis]
MKVQPQAAHQPSHGLQLQGPTSPVLLCAICSSPFLLRVLSFCLRGSTVFDKVGNRVGASTNYSSRIYLSPLFSDSTPQLATYEVEAVDNDTWILGNFHLV